MSAHHLGQAAAELLKTSGAGDSLKALYAKTRKSLKPVKTSTPCEHKMAQQKAPWWDNLLPNDPGKLVGSLAKSVVPAGEAGALAGGIGGGLMSPPKNQVEGMARGAVTGAATLGGASLGGAGAFGVSRHLLRALLSGRASRSLTPGMSALVAGALGSIPVGAAVGAHGGYQGAQAVLGKPSWQMQAGSAIGGSMGGGYKGTFTGLPK